MAWDIFDSLVQFGILAVLWRIGVSLKPQAIEALREADYSNLAGGEQKV